ncbi:glycosyltransferase family 39 protein [Sinomonas sp. JGH33]|uniref:Glycosyltransferase family 39 protein n=1 Tax=Sinomonas terricola TaxID=3110330 RepID=A0ABU5T1P6_9MICC|nr:glycosyltransferase family 39 protein [Sinomonas sp. JGH33]MEA5453419.1 glycosyltransferase family 39 protein [Sinomonas sp. JGH33]
MTLQILRPQLTERRTRGRSARHRGRRWTSEWAVVGGLAVAALSLYLYRLDLNGWGNPFYAAAAQAGAHDWKAFFFGSLDWGNSISIDKPPLSVWPSAIAVRLFGLSSWSVLAPHAILGAATVVVYYLTVRRVFPRWTALTASVFYMTTPVVFLMSRFNNPEATTGFLVALGFYFAVRSRESTRWAPYLLCGTMFGLGFMAKEVQAWIPVPAIAAGLLIFGAGTAGQRWRRVLASGACMLTTGFGWIFIVDSVSAVNRPYVGGSLGNSALELAWDYNGLARFIQVDAPGLTYDGGPGRLFNANLSVAAGWLVLPALMGSVLVLVYAWRRLNRSQQFLSTASAAVFLTVALVLSFMGTMLHSYYTHSLAPWAALTTAAALHMLRQSADRWAQRALTVVVIGAGVYGQLRIIEYGIQWPVWVPWAVGGIGVVAAAAHFLATPPRRALQAGAALLAAVALGAAPAASNIFTASQPQEGTNPASGSTSRYPMALKNVLDDVRASPELSWAKEVDFGAPPDPRLISLMHEASGSSTWTLATYSAQNVAQYQLASDTPVMSIGGWLGSDPTPTLAQFQELVRRGRVAYFADFTIIRDRPDELSPEARSIAAWVEKNFPVVMTGEPTVYDLRTPPP